VPEAFAAGSIGESNLVGPRRPNPTMIGAYECGNEPETPFSGVFYMVAMLFLIFDVEAVLLYPWAVELLELGWAGLWQMVVFLGILEVVQGTRRTRAAPATRLPPRRVPQFRGCR
jgi:NADH-quinone oxidoreductase subunit A